MDLEETRATGSSRPRNAGLASARAFYDALATTPLGRTTLIGFLAIVSGLAAAITAIFTFGLTLQILGCLFDPTLCRWLDKPEGTVLFWLLVVTAVGAFATAVHRTVWIARRLKP